MAKKRMAKIVVTRSSGNVFADLGLPEPEEELVKAQLLICVQHVVRRRRLSPTEAAAIMDIDRSTVSALLGGRGAAISCAGIMQLLTRLGYDIDITIKPTPRGRSRGQLRVPGKLLRDSMVKAKTPPHERSRSKPSFDTRIILPI